jgi:hypothetical protein
VDVFICRLEVARARLNLLRQTLDSERTIFPNSDLA